MTTLEKFHKADARVTEIENNGGLFVDGYATGSTSEYDEALLESQRLYAELQKQGIYPF
jgi:hypothetical protein